jgi:hypothetical protein
MSMRTEDFRRRDEKTGSTCYPVDLHEGAHRLSLGRRPIVLAFFVDFLSSTDECWDFTSRATAATSHVFFILLCITQRTIRRQVGIADSVDELIINN